MEVMKYLRANTQVFADLSNACSTSYGLSIHQSCHILKTCLMTFATKNKKWRKLSIKIIGGMAW
jgi:hypothetical protein